MTTRNSVMSIMKENLRVHHLNKKAVGFKKNISQQVYDSLLSWIDYPVDYPDILDLLNDLENLDEFDDNEALRSLVAFTCLDALARRSTEIIGGTCEELFVRIVDYSKELEAHREDLIKLKDARDMTTYVWFMRSCFDSAIICPNPLLRLEMFRFMRIFKFWRFGDKSSRASIISTLCELHDNYPTLVAETVKMCTATDFIYVIIVQRLKIRDILTSDEYTESKKTVLIAAIVSLTAKFAILEEERTFGQPIGNRHYQYQIEGVCLQFCGLVSDLNHDLVAFAKVVSMSSLLQDYVADALRFITYAFSKLYSKKSAIEKRDRVLSALVTEEQRIRQVHGIIPPSVEGHRMDFFTNISNRADNDDDEWWRGDLCIMKYPFIVEPDQTSSNSSEEMNVLAGAPKGSALSPIYFLN